MTATTEFAWVSYLLGGFLWCSSCISAATVGFLAFSLCISAGAGGGHFDRVFGEMEFYQWKLSIYCQTIVDSQEKERKD